MRISDWSSDVCPSDLVHQRLREARLVSFVVTEAAIAPHVDHDVAVKRLTEFDRHLAGERHRLRIIAIHMENGSLHALRNVAGIGRGSGELRRRGEAHLIIDDEMNASARIIRSEEHTSELQSLMRISYAVFCLKTKNKM